MSDQIKNIQAIIGSKSIDEKTIVSADLSSGDALAVASGPSNEESENDSVTVLNKSEATSGTNSSGGSDIKPLVWSESDSVEEEIKSSEPLKKIFSKLESDVRDSSDDDLVLRYDDDDDNDDNNVSINEEALLKDDNLASQNIGGKAGNTNDAPNAKASSSTTKTDDYKNWDIRDQNTSTPCEDNKKAKDIPTTLSNFEENELLEENSNEKPHGIKSKDCMIEIPSQELENLDESFLLDDSDDNLTENLNNEELVENEDVIKSVPESGDSSVEKFVLPELPKETEEIKVSENSNTEISTNVITDKADEVILDQSEVSAEDACSVTKSTTDKLLKAVKETESKNISNTDSMEVDIKESIRGGEESDGQTKLSTEKKDSLDIRSTEPSSQCHDEKLHSAKIQPLQEPTQNLVTIKYVDALLELEVPNNDTNESTTEVLKDIEEKKVNIETLEENLTSEDKEIKGNKNEIGKPKENEVKAIEGKEVNINSTEEIQISEETLLKETHILEEITPMSIDSLDNSENLETTLENMDLMEKDENMVKLKAKHISKEPMASKDETYTQKILDDTIHEADKEKPLDCDSHLRSEDKTDPILIDAHAAECQQPSTLTTSKDSTGSDSKDAQGTEVLVEMPSTSTYVEEPLSKDLQGIQDLEEIPSTSKDMESDSPGEVPESDSLGLLAESSRVMEDDEEQDEDNERDADDDDDDDDDFDPDDESNQPLTGDNSEDSNEPHLEVEGGKGEKEINFLDTLQETRDREMMAIDDITEEIHEPPELMETSSDAPEANEVEDQTAACTDVSSSVLADASKEKPPASEEAVKISSDSNTDNKKAKGSMLLGLLTSSKSKMPSVGMGADVNIVDLEDSSEDGLSECVKGKEKDTQEKTKSDEAETTKPENFTSVNLPSGIDVMSVSTSIDGGTKMLEKNGELIIAGLPKPQPKKTGTRLINTSELTIKVADADERPSLMIPEIGEPFYVDKTKEDEALEVFSVDSDDEDTKDAPKPELTPKSPERRAMRCVNSSCPGDSGEYYLADAATLAYYDAARKRSANVCLTCAQVVERSKLELIAGVKELKPLLDLEMKKMSLDLVEISDSESDEELEPPAYGDSQPIGQQAAKFLEDNLDEIMNSAWVKFKLDERLKEAEDFFNEEHERLRKECLQVAEMLTDCQAVTDNLRNSLYSCFEKKRVETPALHIVDTPNKQIQSFEEPPKTGVETRRSKRRLSNSSEPTPKRTTTDSKGEEKDDDNVDISVVQLSAEAAPPNLPPPGDVSRPPIYVGMAVYAMKNQFGTWLKARVTEILNKPNQSQNVFTMVRVKFEHKANKNQFKALPARSLAYADPCKVRMTIGTRVIALFKNENKRESYYSGVVAEVPNPVNSYRYLVFFDDGYAQYVEHPLTRLVCECSTLVWEEVHPFSREFVKNYLMSYPERPMVRLHPGQKLKTEWNGKWWICKVTQVDASLAQVYFEEDRRYEWIYRGSTRLAPLYLELQAANKHRARPMPRSTANKAQPKADMPYVEYTREEKPTPAPDQPDQPARAEQELRRQRSVAKKSTTTAQPPPPPPRAPNVNLDAVTSRVVYYTPKNAVRPHDMVPHSCGPHCQRTDTLALRDLRTYNPLAKPLLSGWQRQIVRFKGAKEAMYVAPCGRRLRNIKELHRYLQMVESDMSVDLFDFGPNTHCLAEFVLNKCIVSKKDLSHGKENVPVPCVNYYDSSLPEFCSYNTERTPTAGVPLNLDPDFLCGCDCEDDCEDKSKCACWQMTLEGARTIQMEGDVGYCYRRLPEPLPTGIYECNVRCKCKQTCLNRVAQHPLQLKLQIFKTLNRGWGIRVLNDVPKGAFLCVYAGNLLTDATANLDGLNEGDEYLAELDYIEVVEQLKEGYEDDIPDEDKKLGRRRSAADCDAEESSSSSESAHSSRNQEADDDFRPDAYVPKATFTKDLRKRNKKDKGRGKHKSTPEGDCITISDDEEVREPSRFTAEAGMENEYVSKYRSVRSHFGKDEKCYIMDAKVQGNIGRYLNHSCSPNVFVQNVFVDTHDPRFPWVAFFALSHIKAGTELTWNYNYDIGSVPDKILYCYCGTPNCRGRLL